MPVFYEGVVPEHHAVRSDCGVFDVSHMGEIETSGPGAEALLQQLLSNDVGKLALGGAQYSCLCREDGGVLDDLFTYRRDAGFLTVTNASNQARDQEWFEQHASTSKDVEVEDASNRYAPLAFDRRCMHEFVLSGRPAKNELGVTTLDIAKRLLDYGFHPPTIYFPLLVDEAMMVEPTETEPRENLDAFAEAIEEILAEAEEDPELLKRAPYTTPVRRLDEARAARRNPVLRQPL